MEIPKLSTVQVWNEWGGIPLPAAPPVIEKAFVEEFVSGEINRASTILVRAQETGNGEVGLKRAWLAGAGDVQGLLGQCALASMAIWERWQR